MDETAATAIVQTPSRRMISRDEMNLAEFPLTVLSTRSDPRIKTLEFEDSIVLKDGQTLKRKWVITGADKFGLPTASDDEVLLGLLKLTVDEGIRNRKIFFTRYELLRVLRWTTEGRSYLRLQNALDRLSGVRVKAANAFFDNESKSHSTKNFGVIDAYEINDGREATTKPSFFIWSEEIFKSFQVGFIKKLDLDFYLDLRSAVSKRLYRYLDKHFWYKSSVRINLFTLAHEKIGISRNYKYASLIRQQLDPAVEELVERKFLSHCEYCGKGRNTEIVLYSAQGARRNGGHIEETQGLQALPALGDSREEPLRGVSNALLQRGLKPGQVERLLAGKGAESIKRIGKIIDHFDFLVRSGSRLVSKSPVGFLYKAVENAEQFVLPMEAPKRASGSSPARASADKSREEKLRAEFMSCRREELNRLMCGVEPELLQGIRAEIEQGLRKVKKLISKEHFEQSVEHGLEERLTSLFALPDFEEWVKERRATQ